MKKKRKISIPAAKFGIGENSIAANFKYGDTDAAIGGTTEALPDAIGLLAAPFQKSTASTGKEATMQSIAAIGQGAATGFKVAGPVGAAVGAAVGMIGSGGEKAKMTSFTDYDEGTLGTGLIGAFKNKKLRRERKRIKANAYDNRDAVRGSDALQTDYYEDYANMGTDTFAVGGQTSSLAYVDDGELMRTPDGQISKVPERGKPTDSNLVNIPDGTRILSNTLKVPGTKYTFAQMADKMIKRRKSRGNDMYAQNAAKLNQMNDEQMYNQLFELQEQVKAKKGIKPKTKQLANAYLPGGETGNIRPYGYNRNMRDFKYWDSANNTYSPEYLNWVNSITEQDVKDIYSGKYGDMSTYLGKNRGVIPTVEQARQLMTDRKYGDWHKIGQSYVDSRIAGDVTPSTRYDVGFVSPMSVQATTPVTPVTAANSVGSQRADKTGGANIEPENGSKGSNPNKRSFNWGDILGMLSAWPGIIADLNSKPEHFDAVYNPYANSVRNVFANRRYDIDAAMEEARRNRAVSNYNANQFNSNTGANLAYRLQSARNYDDTVSKLRDAKNNAENQYKADYANTLNDLGRQWVASTNLAVDQNARSRAAARNIQRQGLSELAQLGETYAKSYNQRRRDQEMLPLYNRFLSAGFTDEDLELLRKNLRSYRTRKG